MIKLEKKWKFLNLDLILCSSAHGSMTLTESLYPLYEKHKLCTV